MCALALGMGINDVLAYGGNSNTMMLRTRWYGSEKKGLLTCLQQYAFDAGFVNSLPAIKYHTKPATSAFLPPNVLIATISCLAVALSKCHFPNHCTLHQLICSVWLKEIDQTLKPSAI
jgi:hypothetical protein